MARNQNSKSRRSQRKKVVSTRPAEAATKSTGLCRQATSLLRRLAVPLFLLVGVPLIAFSVFVFRPLQITPPPAQSGVSITIKSGQSLSSIAQHLDEKHIIADAMAFRLLAMACGDSRSLQAGEYDFAGMYSALDVLKQLTAGKVVLQSCTFPEGLTVAEVVQRCVKAGLGDTSVYKKLLQKDEFLRSLHIDTTSLEGYLFPETYRFSPGSSEKTVLSAMVKQTKKHLTPKLLAAAKSYHLNENQLLTLASIVQKEAGNEAEMPMIAAVFHNRLKRGMLLQADPTVIYGISDFNGNITRKDLQTDTPYNTYMRRGLPPGPIANPGLAALLATVHPAQVDYLYFVATGEGGHHFSHTLKEHNRAVRRYQLHR